MTERRPLTFRVHNDDGGYLDAHIGEPSDKSYIGGGSTDYFGPEIVFRADDQVAIDALPTGVRADFDSFYEHAVEAYEYPENHEFYQA